jgi:ketosteroid isomerase-like protein
VRQADDNVATVRRGYDAFNATDLAALTELFDERACWHTPGRSPVAGAAVGRDAVLARLGQYVAETRGTFRADLKRVLTDEDGRVIGIQRNVGERNGKELDVYCCTVFELARGRIVDGCEHVYDLHAWDEFWS